MRIAKIEVDCAPTHCFDIEVEEVHEYLLDDGLVVHNSSKASGVPNAYYPVRGIKIKKTDDASVIDWVATDSDLLEHYYQPAWGLDMIDQIKYNAVIQKFTDQGMSMDVYADRTVDPVIKVSNVIREMAAKVKYGIKGRYYVNSLTSDNEDEYVGYKSQAKTTAESSPVKAVAQEKPKAVPSALETDSEALKQQKLNEARKDYFEKASAVKPLLDTAVLGAKLGIDLSDGKEHPAFYHNSNASQDEDSLTVDESGYQNASGVCSITGGGCTL